MKVRCENSRSLPESGDICKETYWGIRFLNSSGMMTGTLFSKPLSRAVNLQRESKLFTGSSYILVRHVGTTAVWTTLHVRINGIQKSRGNRV
jgi:hypothetical protein